MRQHVILNGRVLPFTGGIGKYASDSRLFVERPEWVLKGPSGRPLKCGWTAPGLWIYALDVTHPEALRYIRRVVATATREWGFQYLKLDFLHTAAMPGARRHAAGVSRAAALHTLAMGSRDAADDETTDGGGPSALDTQRKLNELERLSRFLEDAGCEVIALGDSKAAAIARQHLARLG